MYLPEKGSKGLCPQSDRTGGDFALDLILSGQPCKDFIDAIHTKLQEVSFLF